MRSHLLVVLLGAFLVNCAHQSELKPDMESGSIQQSVRFTKEGGKVTREELVNQPIPSEMSQLVEVVGRVSQAFRSTKAEGGWDIKNTSQLDFTLTPLANRPNGNCHSRTLSVVLQSEGVLKVTKWSNASILSNILMTKGSTVSSDVSSSLVSDGKTVFIQYILDSNTAFRKVLRGYKIRRLQEAVEFTTEIVECDNGT